MPKTRIRVLCVDDHPMVREGIAKWVNLQPDMKVVAEASTAEEALAKFRRCRPDVTLMDLHMPGMSGLDCIHAMRREDPNARIVVLTMLHGEEDIYRALHAGAAAYVSKRTVSDDLIRVIREVLAGGRPIPPDIAAQLALRATQPALTTREVHVLELIALGMRNKEIAAAMAISEDTVAVHIRNLFVKLEVKDRTAAATVALRRGIIHI